MWQGRPREGEGGEGVLTNTRWKAGHAGYIDQTRTVCGEGDTETNLIYFAISTTHNVPCLLSSPIFIFVSQSINYSSASSPSSSSPFSSSPSSCSSSPSSSPHRLLPFPRQQLLPPPPPPCHPCRYCWPPPLPP